jgi:hypothetical protein
MSSPTIAHATLLTGTLRRIMLNRLPRLDITALYIMYNNNVLLYSSFTIIVYSFCLPNRDDSGV